MEEILTIKGYAMFEVISAFQKEIRRGNEMNAMFWGVELYESGFIGYAWKRMVIIAIEDIGLADPLAPIQIDVLKRQFNELSENSHKDTRQQQRLAYTQAILYLVHAKKSRHTDWALNYHWDSHLDPNHKIEIPDYALDIHTRRGKRLGKTIKDFFTDGSFVNNHKPVGHEIFYKEECEKRWLNEEWRSWAKDLKAKLKEFKENRGRRKPSAKSNTPPPQTNLFGND